MKYEEIAVMTNKRLNQSLIVLLLMFWTMTSFAVQNPDQISVYFPAFEGPDKLGLNVSTVLSLQLAQTTRRYPWPDNPRNHDFGEGMIRWSAVPLEHYSVSELTEAAQNYNLLAQIVVAGKVRRFGRDFVVELDIVLPEYRRAPSTGCSNSINMKCDFRQNNFEIWQTNIDGGTVTVDLPKRYFNISTIVLKPKVVNEYRTASGLTIRESLDGGAVLGKTGDRLRFVEFNKRLPGAPAKIRSGGVEGYISLPELSDEVSEFADMVGGILQVFRGDWEWAIKSFTNVLKKPKTRIPLRVDALLYRGMTKFKNGENGYEDIAAAAELAPYDSTVTKYLVMALLSNNSSKDVIAHILKQKAYLFTENDEWLKKLSHFFPTN
jgi:hypothetical protein